MDSPAVPPHSKLGTDFEKTSRETILIPCYEQCVLLADEKMIAKSDCLLNLKGQMCPLFRLTHKPNEQCLPLSYDAISNRFVGEM